MKISSDTVLKVGKLANLKLTPEQTDKYSDQLSKILDYVEFIKEVDTKDVEPTFNLTGLSNVFQPDITTTSLSQKDATLNKENRDGYFVTKGVFTDE